MWKSPYKELPSDEQEVWIRSLAVYGDPTLAVYDESNQMFIVTQTGLVIPAWQVARWKSQ